MCQLNLPLEVKILSFQTDGPRSQTRVLLGRDMYVNLFGDCLSKFSLQAQDVAPVPLIVFCPHVTIRRRRDQLRADPHPVAHPVIVPSTM